MPRVAGSPPVVIGAIIVVFAAVVAGVFGVVTLVDRLQGPHVPDGWVYVEYTVRGGLSDDQQEALARSVAFRLRVSQAADARWWPENDGFVVAVPPEERTELAQLPHGAPELQLRRVSSAGSVGKGKITSDKGCRKPPVGYACDRDRNRWYRLARPIASGANVTSTKTVAGAHGVTASTVSMRLDKAGTKRFAKATKVMAKAHGDRRRLAVVFGGAVLEAPVVHKPMTDGVVRISGFSSSDGRDLAAAIKASNLHPDLSKGPLRIAG